MRRSSRLAAKKRPTYDEAKPIYREAKENSSLNQKARKSSSVAKNGYKSVEKANTTSLDECQNIKLKSERKDVTDIRTCGQMYVGAHTSISGGIWKAVEGAAAIGAKAFGLFLHNQQRWAMTPMAEDHIRRFRDACKKHGYAPQFIVPHGSYLMNCGSPREDVREKSVAMLTEELKRCEDLGLIYFNFHPGSTLGKMTVSECVSLIAEGINKAHRSTKYVITLLENMSCQGNTVGGKLEELRAIIDLVDDKSRVGVCIDTCHAHAAGYDLSTQDGYNLLMKDLESIIGFEYVKAFHLNDSKGPSGCCKDRHENIGKGTIGLEGFQRLMNDSRLCGHPMILETPLDIDDIMEIELLYSLIQSQ